jgi:hypothetical protein
MAARFCRGPPPLSLLPPHVSICRAREAASVRGTPVCFQRSSISLPAAFPHRVYAELGRLPPSVEHPRMLPTELHPAVCVVLPYARVDVGAW